MFLGLSWELKIEHEEEEEEQQQQTKQIHNKKIILDTDSKSDVLGGRPGLNI